MDTLKLSFLPKFQKGMRILSIPPSGYQSASFPQQISLVKKAMCSVVHTIFSIYESFHKKSEFYSGQNA